ncbi:MAG: hypothetical protein H0W73_14010 [Bacteroidetes bacterium]|nr:hypothetical protein [Bacteroidota bacterium]
MISNYLELLYSNCKILTKDRSYNREKFVAISNEHIQTVIKENGLASESDLIDLLISKPFASLKSLLDRSKFLYIFYLVNSLNEYKQEDKDFDNLGRSKYENSVMKDVGIENNLVLQLIKDSINENEILKQLFKINSHKSYFYLSHDIDSVYGSFMQDGLWAVKHMRIDVLLRLFYNAVIARPDWLNFDLIMKTESEYDFRSTFYWLVNRGKIDARQTNSDYSITSKKIIDSIDSVKKNGFENGLHKSISTDSFKNELSKMPVNVVGNRYHYLKFQLPNTYNKIEEAGLQLDASLGFAEHYGFRNGYGYPFHPYSMVTNKAYSFLEVPLNIMDGTFQAYMKIPVEKTADTIINFLEKNNNDTLLSVLWHNTFFTNYKYKGYLNEYKKILKYLYDMNFQNINQTAIINDFSWKIK